MAEVYVVSDAKTSLSELPTWDDETGRLLWAAPLDGLLFSSAADGGNTRLTRFGAPINAIGLRKGAGVILVSGTTVWLFDPATGARELVGDAAPGPDFNCNDGCIDRQGRFVFGLADRTLVGKTAADGVTPRGGYFRVDADLSITQIVDSVGVTNGPCFSADGAALYCNDSWAGQVMAFDYAFDTGSATGRRIVASFEGVEFAVNDYADAVMPDGATVDSEGCIWVAAVRGGEVLRYTPEGELDRRIEIPVGSPTSVAFGGPDLATLYVTSMAGRDANAPRRSMLDGALFAVRDLGVAGIPEPRFAG